MNFNKNEADMHNMFLKESHARSNYSHNIRMKKGTGEDFYKDDETEK